MTSTKIQNFGFKSIINGPYRMQIIDLFGILVLGFRNESARDDMAELYESKGFFVQKWYAKEG